MRVFQSWPCYQMSGSPMTLGPDCPYCRTSLKAIWGPLWGQTNTPAL